MNIFRSSGFTLIETMLYLALFSMLAGGAVAAGYNLIEAANRNQTRAVLIEEGNFLLGKIGWSLQQAGTVASGSPQELSVSRLDSSFIDFSLADDSLVMAADGYSAPLNNAGTKVSEFSVELEPIASIELIHISLVLSAITVDGKTVNQRFDTVKTLFQ